ncbi:hypothetical protein SmJEL517_g04669 [Synchytrium microbalum]|uniref:RING-type domain-containing protein n=1 Tax=Synchytrium microbalum TaxID=1806994 RepID=A0A507BYD0_9FUNG|nr:uncharacterized protein SmJEL517_g04669 [Synchytrium microbalum]TPX32121.1 hypothetical protein SmJEL517_g04669 [Synchytrium microbalum]
MFSPTVPTRSPSKEDEKDYSLVQRDSLEDELSEEIDENEFAIEEERDVAQLVQGNGLDSRTPSLPLFTLVRISTFHFGYHFFNFLIGAVIMPDQIRQIVGDESKGTAMSIVTLVAGIFTLFFAIAYGALNDRNSYQISPRHGKRRPSIVLGTGVMCLSLFFLWSDHSLGFYSVAYLLLTFGVIVATTPFQALIAEVTPRDQKVELAMALDTLPNSADAARDFSLWHSSSVVPSIVAVPIAGTVRDILQSVGDNAGIKCLDMEEERTTTAGLNSPITISDSPVCQKHELDDPFRRLRVSKGKERANERAASTAPTAPARIAPAVPSRPRRIIKDEPSDDDHNFLPTFDDSDDDFEITRISPGKRKRPSEAGTNTPVVDLITPSPGSKPKSNNSRLPSPPKRLQFLAGGRSRTHVNKKSKLERSVSSNLPRPQPRPQSTRQPTSPNLPQRTSPRMAQRNLLSTPTHTDEDLPRFDDIPTNPIEADEEFARRLQAEEYQVYQSENPLQSIQSMLSQQPPQPGGSSSRSRRLIQSRIVAPGLPVSRHSARYSRRGYEHDDEDYIPPPDRHEEFVYDQHDDFQRDYDRAYQVYNSGYDLAADLAGDISLAQNLGNYGFIPDTYEGLLALSERIGDAKPKGISVQFMSQLPSRKYVGGSLVGEDARCAICLTAYEDGNDVKTVPCGHQFHDEVSSILSISFRADDQARFLILVCGFLVEQEWYLPSVSLIGDPL